MRNQWVKENVQVLCEKRKGKIFVAECEEGKGRTTVMKTISMATRSEV